MDSSCDGIPEEFVDPLVNEFAYDPIRLPITEDPAEVLYNRRTLEKIWDSKHDATNPYTRQPLDIRKAIPQSELRQQMSQYLMKNSTDGLEVIPMDYTKPLNSTDMECLLRELDIAFKHCLHLGRNSNGEESKKTEDTFLSNKGYEYLWNVINPELRSLRFYFYRLIEDTKEVYKEIPKIVDVVGLKEKDLQTVPPENVSAFLLILCDLIPIKQLKIQSMVVRIYHLMYNDCIDYLVRTCQQVFSKCSFELAITVLYATDFENITNEDLYNLTAILKAAWTRQLLLNVQYYYIDALVNAVIICISRFEYLHAASTHRAQASHEDHAQEEEEEKKNINLISRALDEGLFLIDCFVMSEEEKEELYNLDIVKDIVRMVEHVLVGFKFFQSSHLRFGLKITVSLCREKERISLLTRNNVVKVFGDFLGSHFVDEFDTDVKLLLQDCVRNAS